DKEMVITSKSRLCIRTPKELIGDLLALMGKEIDVSGYKLVLGEASVRTLKPMKNLYSPLVVICGAETEKDFFDSANKQLMQLDILAKAIPFCPHGFTVRRTFKIKTAKIPGFAISITDLSNEDSVKLQSAGIGGRRRMGCGIFIPSIT